MLIEDLYVRSLGVHLPDRMTVSSAVAHGWYDADEAEATGICSVAVAGPLSAPEMALSAAGRAVARCGGATLSHLFYADVYHSGPEGWCPHAYVQRHLDAATNAFAVGVRQGCNGFFAALRLAADALARSGADDTALIVTADNFDSPQLDRWSCNPGLVMGDGATAAILGRSSGFARVRALATITLPELEGLHRGDSPLHPPGVFTDRPLDFGARFAEFAAGGGFADGGGLRFVRTCAELLDRLLDDSGLTLGQIDRVAFNHGSRELVADRLTPLGLDLSRSTWEFGRTVGHLGAGDQLAAFEHLMANGDLGPGDHLLMLGVGPGVNVAGAVLEIHAPAPWRG